MTKSLSTDLMADPRTTAGELINTLCCTWGGRMVNAIEVRRVGGEHAVYNVVILSPKDPDFRAFHSELGSRREAENVAVGLVGELLHEEITPESVIRYCDC